MKNEEQKSQEDKNCPRCTNCLVYGGKIKTDIQTRTVLQCRRCGYRTLDWITRELTTEEIETLKQQNISKEEIN